MLRHAPDIADTRIVLICSGFMSTSVYGFVLRKRSKVRDCAHGDAKE